MSLLQQINQDRNDARKDRNVALAQTLTTLVSACEKPGFDDGKRESTDAEVIAEVKKFYANTLGNTQLGGLTDFVRNEFMLELAVYEKYLPKQLTEVEMHDIITAHFIITTDKALKGKVMGYFKTNYAGQYDGKVLAAWVDLLIHNAK